MILRKSSIKIANPLLLTYRKRRVIPKIRLVSHIEITPAVIIELDERDLYFLFVVSEKNYHVILE